MKKGVSKSIMSFAGKWKGEKSWKEIYKEIKEARKVMTQL